MGNYRHHHHALEQRLRVAGYDVRSDIHVLDRFGLPQIRERALVVASRIGPARTLEDLWRGWSVRRSAMRWTPETGQVAKRESSLGAAVWPKVRHDQYSEETRG
jgi:DNA (cytosine-5)-methyltransferase 1